MTQRKLMSVSKCLSTNYSDRKENGLAPNAYSPGSTLTTVFVILSIHVVEISKTSDELGQ